MLKFDRADKWKNRLRWLRDYRLNPLVLDNIPLDKSFRKELYRKAIHLSSLWIPAVIYWFHSGVSVTLFAFLLAADAILEYANFKKQTWARKIFGVLFAKTMRKQETVHASFQATGSMYVMAAAIVCVMLFSKSVAAIALTIMLVSDTAAALFGKAYGSKKIYKSKTLEGTIAFFVSALVVTMVYSTVYPFNVASVVA